MSNQGEESVRGRSAGVPGTRYLLATCGVVATAAYLGAAWLRHPLMGLPAGVWVIGIAHAAGYAWSFRSARRAVLGAGERPKMALPIAPGAPASAGLAGLDMTLILGRLGAVAWESLRGLGESIGMSAQRVRAAESRASVWLDHASRNSRELRIGLDVGPDVLRTLKAPGELDTIKVQWVATPPGGDAQDLMRRLRLDALVRQNGSGSMVVSTPESDGREAAWYDWSSVRPLTYGSVFPTRIDPGQVTIAELDAADRAEMALLRAVTVAAAALSRIGPRLSLTDRLRGRSPLAGSAAASVVDRSILLMAELLNSGGGPTPIRRAAARAVSAFLAASDSWVAPEVRRKGMLAALAVIGEEPEALLRGAAVGLACQDDQAGLAALTKAASVICARRELPTIDHLAFLQAEVECGAQGPLTLGRVAAGVCLVCATSPAERVPFLRADFMDDVRYSAWLVGRDQDRAVLYEVFHVMEKSLADVPTRRAA